jgi:hypothetical protein
MTEKKANLAVVKEDEAPKLEMPNFIPEEWAFISQAINAVDIPANSARGFVILADKLEDVRQYLIQEGLVEAEPQG